MTRTLLSVALALLVHANAVAQTAAPIGTVLVARGSAEARAVSGDLRVLKRRADIHAGDTLLTGSDGFLQVRMVDAAQLSFGPGTEFTFDDYRVDADAATPDVALMRLLRGCFRTVSGSAGREAGDEYRIDTAVASISMPGGRYRSVFSTGALFDGVLYTGTFDGGTEVVDTQGRGIGLGLGSDYDFSRTARGAAPEGLASEPAEFGFCTSTVAPSPGTPGSIIAPSSAP